jgi:hypothetical protein
MWTEQQMLKFLAGGGRLALLSSEKCLSMEKLTQSDSNLESCRKIAEEVSNGPMGSDKSSYFEDSLELEMPVVWE